MEQDIKYLKFYQPNDIYWGIGIENETYFISKEFSQKMGSDIKKNRKRERYSVDYNTNYHQQKLIKYLNKIFLNNDIYKIPIYINSHSFNKTDINNEHATLYTKDTEPNQKFSGKTIFELLNEIDEIFKEDFNDKYVFDGDTIEFITQNFYKTTVNNCVQELTDYKNSFLLRLNSFLEKYQIPSFDYPQINYGLVQYKTNLSNISMFNNGTYHINLTMPTKLNDKAEIMDLENFEIKHKNAIRLFQWIEPLLIALYGSPDIFSFNDNKNYCAGSLRLTASRYVSIGTFDTNSMKKGKQLNDLKTEMFIYLYENSWYNKIYKKTGYLPSEKIGYDINYAKHYNAGIEFRIFDYFPEIVLNNLINFLILLLDHSLHNEILIPADDYPIWHEFTKNVLLFGYSAPFPVELASVYQQILFFPYINEKDIIKYFDYLIEYLYKSYHNEKCSTLMSPNMPRPKLYNVNRYMWENNYLQYIPISNKKHIRVTKLFDLYQKSQKNNLQLKNQKDIKLFNLLKSTQLINESGLNLEIFYQRLLILSENKIHISNYLVD